MVNIGKVVSLGSDVVRAPRVVGGTGHVNGVVSYWSALGSTTDAAGTKFEGTTLRFGGISGDCTGFVNRYSNIVGSSPTRSS